jgi:hypothetical protein
VTNVLPALVSSVSVTLMNSDWSGEQVKVQKMSKKFSRQAGHEEMMPSASFRFFPSASIYVKGEISTVTTGLSCP